MKLIKIYQCLCDETRLRILYLLAKKPLCVSELQEILQMTQVKISKHLAYLKEREMVEAERKGYWMIYSIPKEVCPELEANLKCLQDCVTENTIFKDDLQRLQNIKILQGKS